MTTRQELLTQWQQRLADAEQACDAAPSWAERMRVKLYRFLLAMYGRTTWPGSKDDVDNSQVRAANSQLIVAEPQEALAGKEPRTRAQILKGLRNLKGLGDELAPAGPLADGLLPDSPVVVAAFKRERSASAAIRKLQQAGFEPAISHRGGLYQIFVSAVHSSQATALLRVNSPSPRSRGSTLTISRPPQHILLFGAIFFGVIGGLLAGLLVQLVFVDLSHLPYASLPTDMDVISLGLFAIGFSVAAGVLFRIWSSSRPSQVNAITFPPFVTPILCCGVVLLFFGIVLTAYLTAFHWFPLNPRFAEDWPTPNPQAANWIAAAALCLNLMGIQMLWVWWKWRRVQLAAKLRP